MGASELTMSIEVEKKYRLTEDQRASIVRRLTALGAQRFDTEFEVNTLYSSRTVDLENGVIRLRRVGDHATLTFKKRFSSASALKCQLEEETRVSDAETMHRILGHLGFSPSLVYEKRRQTWKYADTEIAIDELPFGLFMEIEGGETEIENVERELEGEGLQAEEATYPQLIMTYGTRKDEVIEARFNET